MVTCQATALRPLDTRLRYRYPNVQDAHRSHPRLLSRRSSTRKRIQMKECQSATRMPNMDLCPGKSRRPHHRRCQISSRACGPSAADCGTSLSLFRHPCEIGTGVSAYLHNNTHHHVHSDLKCKCRAFFDGWRRSFRKKLLQGVELVWLRA